MKVVDIAQYRDNMMAVLGSLNGLNQRKTRTITRRTITDDLIPMDIPNDKPVLYWFLITEKGGLSNGEIAERFSKKKRNKKGYSAVNLNKARQNTDTVCLYVGKVRSDFKERMKVHLGLGNNKQTQGLRLNTWLPLKVSVQLCYIQIDLKEDVAFLVDPFEEYLKREMRPVLGQK